MTLTLAATIPSAESKERGRFTEPVPDTFEVGERETFTGVSSAFCPASRLNSARPEAAAAFSTSAAEATEVPDGQANTVIVYSADSSGTQNTKRISPEADGEFFRTAGEFSTESAPSHFSAPEDEYEISAAYTMSPANEEGNAARAERPESTVSEHFPSGTVEFPPVSVSTLLMQPERISAAAATTPNIIFAFLFMFSSLKKSTRKFQFSI